MKTIKLLILTVFISLNSVFAHENTENTSNFLDLEDRYFGEKPPGLIPKVFAPDIVSPEGNFEGGGFSPDMKEFYFTRKNGKYKKRTFFVIRYENNSWGHESETDIRWPQFSEDGNMMYGGKEYRERTDTGWSESKSQGEFLKDQAHGISLSSKGTYYFGFYEKAGRGKGSIRYSRLIDGKRENPVKMSKAINTGKDIAHPYIAPDESYLLWDVVREDGYGQADIYISFRQKDGSWGAAINMGDKINTSSSESSPGVTHDGKYFFFSRSGTKVRADGSTYRVGKSYWVDAQVIESLRPLQSSVEESNSDTRIDLIKKVETGLTTRVYIAGDSTWSIEERMKHYGIPGVSIAVINNGKVEWAKGYGVMDKESKVPVTDKTLFQVSTIGMSLTAYGALRLVDQNKVSLDEDINSYLKSWKLPDSEFTKEKKATIKNLLSHSAGINVHDFSGYSTDIPVPTFLEVLKGSPPANSSPIIVDKALNESLWISAGGYTIIQQMMMDVEGKKFPELMNELVLQPLEMNNSTFNQLLTTEQLKMAATGYLSDGSMVKGKRHIYPELASNGLWTNAEDLAKFVINIQQTLKDNRNKGLSKDMAELMLTPSAKNRYGQYGLGFSIYNKKDEIFNKKNDIYFEHHGWSTGFYSRMTAHRDKDYGVVVLTNTTHPAFVFELFRSVALAYEWDNYFPLHKKMEIEESLVDEITGRYQYDNMTYEVFQKDNLLLTKNILDVKAEELVKVSDSVFVKRNSSRLIQFKPNSENEKVNMLYINRKDETIASTFVKMDNDKKDPVEFLLEGDFEKALKAYRILIKHDATHPTVTEDYLNNLGYRFLNQERIKLSQNTFKVNMMLYPDSFKVYDSYAEACMKIEEIDLAISNYSKSLELNPQNSHAKDMLKELQKSE